MPARLIKKMQKIYAAVEKKQKKLQATVESSIRESQGYTSNPDHIDGSSDAGPPQDLLGHQMADLIQERALQDELLRIIRDKKVQPVFQPIVSLADGEIMGYEALARGPKDSPLHMPSQLFAVAARHRMLLALEHVCREVSIQHRRTWLPCRN